MASIFDSKLEPRLRSHLQGVNLQSLSRIPASRLAERAIPNIGTIELITSSSFAHIYDALYIQMFPHRAERERSDLIVSRLAAQDAGSRSGHAPYRLIGIRDYSGAAIGAAHISVLPLPGSLAVPYLQYLYVRPQNRRQDMSEVLHTLVLGVAAADAAAMDGGRTVPFTLFETEPPGHGDDEASRAYSHSRALIHASTGGMALVLVRKASESSSNVDSREEEPPLSAHVQPGLELGSPPLTLVWVVRQSPAPGRQNDIGAIAKHLVAAYYRSLRDEGFPEENIQVAERMVGERWRGRECVLVPLSEVKPFLH